MTSGKTSKDKSMPPPRVAKVRAAPMEPIKLSRGVPMRSESAKIPVLCASRLNWIARIGEAIVSTSPELIQCAAVLESTASGNGIAVKTN